MTTNQRQRFAHAALIRRRELPNLIFCGGRVHLPPGLGGPPEINCSRAQRIAAMNTHRRGVNASRSIHFADYLPKSKRTP